MAHDTEGRSQLQRQYQRQRQQQQEQQNQDGIYRPLDGALPEKQQQAKHNPVSEARQSSWHRSDQ